MFDQLVDGVLCIGGMVYLGWIEWFMQWLCYYVIVFGIVFVVDILEYVDVVVIDEYFVVLWQDVVYVWGVDLFGMVGGVIWCVCQQDGCVVGVFGYYDYGVQFCIVVYWYYYYVFVVVVVGCWCYEFFGWDIWCYW